MVGLFRFPKRRLRKLVQAGEYKEALEFGKSLEKKLSKDPDFFFIMGSTYYMLGEAKNALDYFNKVLSINDTDIETLILKANVHLYLKEKENAIDCCNRVFKVDPKNAEADEILTKLEQL